MKKKKAAKKSEPAGRAAARLSNYRPDVTSGQPLYRLHIDVLPHPRAKLIPLSGAAQNQDAARKDHYAGRTATGKVFAFIWDKLQFFFVSVIVFAIIYVVMNWGALQINLVHYWEVFRGVQSPLEEVVKEKPAAPEKFIITATPRKQLLAIPPLNLEVYPTDMRIIIPRINQNVPVVGVKNDNLIARQWNDLEADIQKALRNGVIHYPGTSLPGDNGNVVLTGHSSYYAWDPGRFKDVFALLHDVRQGDRVVVFFNQKKFIYEVNLIKVVLPKDVDVLGQTPNEQLTLITCTPIGTNIKRLIIQAKLVSKT